MEKERLKEKLASYENKTDANSLFCVSKLKHFIGNIEMHESYFGKEVYPFDDRPFYHNEDNKIKELIYLDKVLYNQYLHNDFLISYKLRIIKHLEKSATFNFSPNELEGKKDLINFFKKL